MNTTRAVLALAIGFIGFSMGHAHAEDKMSSTVNPLGITSLETMNLDWNPAIKGDPFIMIPDKADQEELPELLLTPHHKPSTKKPTSNVANKKGKEKDWEKKIMAQIPQARRLKQVWNLVDGDTDLHFTGLRVDRGNRGVKYSTHHVPIIGEMKDVEMEFMAGEDFEVSLESRHIPFAGALEGFNFKSSVGTDDSKIFARYTIKFD